jgi:prepilin-type N-terminal cleavage/methylation domain-containing protein
MNTLRRGFTLIELLIVATVAAVLLTLAIPTYADFSARHQLAAATDTLVLELRQARYDAVQRGTALYVTPSAGAQWCVVVSTDPACRCGDARCALRTLDSAAFPDVAMSVASPVRFDGRQGAADAGLVAALSANRRFGTELQLSASGRPRVCASGAAMPNLPSC